MSDVETDALVPYEEPDDESVMNSGEHCMPASYTGAANSDDNVPAVYAAEHDGENDSPAELRSADSGATGLPSVYTRRADDLVKLYDWVRFRFRLLSAYSKPRTWKNFSLVAGTNTTQTLHSSTMDHSKSHRLTTQTTRLAS